MHWQNYVDWYDKDFSGEEAGNMDLITRALEQGNFEGMHLVL